MNFLLQRKTILFNCSIDIVRKWIRLFRHSTETIIIIMCTTFDLWTRRKANQSKMFANVGRAACWRHFPRYFLHVSIIELFNDSPAIRGKIVSKFYEFGYLRRSYEMVIFTFSFSRETWRVIIDVFYDETSFNFLLPERSIVYNLKNPTVICPQFSHSTRSEQWVLFFFFGR